MKKRSSWNNASLAIGLCFALMVGCQREQPIITVPVSPTAPQVAPWLLEEPSVTLLIKQRSTMTVPKSGDKLRLTIDDITRGQVMTSLAHADQGSLLATTSFKANDSHSFALDGREYRLTLVKLNNALLGTDSAEFRCERSPVAPAETSTAPLAAPAALSESEKIERLIQFVESLGGAEFIRNGTAYSTQEAAAHLRSKLTHAGSRVTTAEQFIEQIASKSSVSGEPYQIRLPDGTIKQAGPFLSEQLWKIDQGK